MEPRAQRIAHPERTSLLDQDEEGRLKGVFDVVRVDQQTPANPQDHRPMALDQGSKRLLGGVTRSGRKPLQELPVGQLAGRSDCQQRAKLLQDPLIPSRRHRSISPPESRESRL